MSTLLYFILIFRMAIIIGALEKCLGIRVKREKSLLNMVKIQSSRRSVIIKAVDLLKALLSLV